MTDHNTEMVHDEMREDRRGFEVQLGDFSGPLDLLCHLVESREMDPAKLNLTELVSQYVSFLVKSSRTTLNEMAEFFSFASRLLLRKVHSLFPTQPDAEDENGLDETYDETEEELQRLIEAFRPYRNAASRLEQLQSKRERSFTRIPDEDAAPFYDLGDLYGLASKWWELLDRYNESRKSPSYEDDDPWDDIPDAVPEERQVEQIMDEIMQLIKYKKVTLREILTERNRKILIVTLLALLEMSRLGMINLTQSETLGDVEIVSA